MFGTGHDRAGVESSRLKFETLPLRAEFPLDCRHKIRATSWKSPGPGYAEAGNFREVAAGTGGDGAYGAGVIERINPPVLARPSGFSHAVRASGTTVYLAGQTGMDADGAIVHGGVVAQFEQALTNLLTALAAAGGAPDQLVRVTIYIADVPAYRAAAAEIGAVWRRLAGRDYPAMAGIGVARLWDDDALVEIEGIAVLP